MASADDGFLRIAHRGASAYAPENTLAAFVKAAELGAHMVEMDVHTCGDGTAVIIHDADLRRTTDGTGTVYEYTVERLKRFDAGNGERIPTLAEAIACCRAHGVAPYLEIKDSFSVAAVAQAIREHDLYEIAIATSFRPDWLADLQAIDPRIPTAVLFGSVHVDPVALARAAHAQYVHPGWEYQGPEPHTHLTPEWIARVRAADLKIISWHEERPREIAALRRLGVDGICSNAPDLLR
jgi:glycerophosphoryl diester phosphodiesterase